MASSSPIASWARMFAEVLDEVDSAFLVHGPWPDSMAATALLRRAISEQGVGVSLRPALPEELLSVVEEAFAEDSALVLVDLIPAGPGPIEVAEQLWGQVLVIDHYEIDRPRIPARVLRLNPLGSGLPPLPASRVAMTVAQYLCPDLPPDLWVGRIGCLEPGARCEISPHAETSREGEGVVSRVYETLLEAVAGDPESGVVLGVAALEECFEDPTCLLGGRYPLSKALLGLADRGKAILGDLVQAKPLISSQSLLVIPVEDPRIRHAAADSLSSGRDVAGAVYSDDVMAVVSLRSRAQRKDLPSLVHLSMLDLEGSYFGSGGFVEAAVRAQQLETLLRRISELLES